MSTPAISSLKGTGYQQVSMPRLSPQQQQLFSQVFGAISPNIGQAYSRLGQLAGGDAGAYEELEAPAFRNLQRGLGETASRFSSMGTGARRSSGFNLEAGDLSRQLAENLQSKRLGLQQNAIQQLMSLFGNLMGTQTSENLLVPRQKPFWQELLGSLAPGLGQAATGFGGQYGLMKLFPQAFGMGG